MLSTEECPGMNVGTGKFSDDDEMTRCTDDVYRERVPDGGSHMPAPASSDSNSDPEPSVGKSPRMSVIGLIVLHPYTKLDVRRPSSSEEMWLIFGHGGHNGT